MFFSIKDHLGNYENFHRLPDHTNYTVDQWRQELRDELAGTQEIAGIRHEVLSVVDGEKSVAIDTAIIVDVDTKDVPPTRVRVINQEVRIAIGMVAFGACRVAESA